MLFRWATAADDQSEGKGLIAYERVLEEQRVLVVINTNDPVVNEGEATSAQTRQVDGQGMTVGFPNGSVLVDKLNGQADRYTVDGNGQVVIDVPARSAKILVLE